MFSNYFKSIEGIEIYPLISLFLFLMFFIVLIVWAIKVDKNYLKKMEGLPLDPSDDTDKNFTGE